MAASIENKIARNQIIKERFMNMALKSSRLSQGVIDQIDTPQSGDPEELIPWSLKQFSRQNLVITTAFGMEGCALVDMYSRFASHLTVAYTIRVSFSLKQEN